MSVWAYYKIQEASNEQIPKQIKYYNSKQIRLVSSEAGPQLRRPDIWLLMSVSESKSAAKSESRVSWRNIDFAVAQERQEEHSILLSPLYSINLWERCEILQG